MTGTVFLVLSEKPDHLGTIDTETTVVAIWSDPDVAERFAERYQRQVGRRLVIWVDEWSIDTEPERIGDAA